MGLVSHRMNRATSRFDWRDVAIVAIKAIHSGIFLLNAASILHICWVAQSPLALDPRGACRRGW